MKELDLRTDTFMPGGPRSDGVATPQERPASPVPAPPRAALDGPGETVALRPDDFKLLSSDTRVQILKLLDARARTGTELGKDLGLEKSTVHQHLERLVEGGLVHRREDDRLWVYYDLAPRGRRLLHPPRSGFTLLLAGSLLSAGASLTLAASWLLGSLAAPMRESSPVQAPGADGAADAPAGGASADEAGDASPAVAGDGGWPLPPLATAAAACFALAALLGSAAWVARPK